MVSLISSLTERSPVLLRALSPADAEEAAAIIRSAFAAQSHATQPPSSALGETGESVAAKIEAGGGVGAFAGEDLVGLALWRMEGGALHVARVCVLPSWRGQNVARRLIAACEAEVVRLGADRMRLRARLELPENEKMFERFGFARIGVEAHEGFESPTTAVMEKRLA
jgi:tRNA threonylcarbamoyladenosine biosynthesis protein TsaE